jgi:RecA/RadA recombinase
MIFPISNLNVFFKSFKKPLLISIWGDFGVGKTTFALQTALNSSKNRYKTMYIYTKPNFPTEKITNMIRNSPKTLDRISFIQSDNFSNLYKIIFNLEFLILRNLNASEDEYILIVIDSLTDLYRLELNKEKKEKNYNLNYQLNHILANLSYLCNSYNIGILIVNEKVRKRVDGEIKDIQSGGKVMDFWILFDIEIERTEKMKERRFILTMQPNLQQIEFTSSLTEKGFQ